VSAPNRTGGRRSARPQLALLAGPSEPESAPAILSAERDKRLERDVLGDLANEIEQAISDLPERSPWRQWLTPIMRVLATKAALPLFGGTPGRGRS
jgi:hypothetical protein